MYRFLVLFTLIGSCGYAQSTDDVAMTLNNGKYSKQDPLFNDSSAPIKAEKNDKIVEPQINVQTKNPYLGYLSVDYLFWGAKKTGVFLDMDHFSVNDNDVVGDPIELKAKKSSGVRIELGFSNIYDWMIDAAFTYYGNHLNRHYTPKPGEATSLVHQNFSDYLNSSDTYSKLTYWTLDFEVSTLFNFSSSVTFKPIMSLRTASFKTKLNYSATQSDIDSGDFDETINAQYPLRFCGCGPKIGMNGYFKFGKTGLDIFGGINGSLVYGKVHYRDYRSDIDSHANENLIDVRGTYKDLKASLGLLLGAEWKYFFDCDTKAIMIRLNWETNYWWDLTDHYQLTEFICNKSLILYGFNVGIGFEF